MIIKTLSHIRRYCTSQKKPFFITTPIFYVNAAPHIGHLYSAVISDAINRFEALVNPNRDGIFSTGTDEHGTKIQQAAAAQNTPVNRYCDNISREYEVLFRETNIGYSQFIRTSSERHKEAVTEFWKLLQSRGHIYTSNYSGWYCVSDETFLTETQLKLRDDGRKVSIESGHPVEWTEETNYMFRLSQFQDDILHWIKTGNRVKPAKFEKILIDSLQEPLPDLSVSRPTSRVHWGIPVPSDNSQTIYVWLDALINYLTCAGFPSQDYIQSWPPNVQVIGKDILKFHGIYWPAFLIAAGMKPPQQLHVHSHWTVDGEKMSKSKFNVVDPFERMKLYSSEGLRYFLLREGVAHSDGNYSDTKIFRILNSELADTFGNLLSRCCAKTLNPDQVWPKLDKIQFDELMKLDELLNLIKAAEKLPDKTFSDYKSCNFHFVADQVMAVLHLCNNFVETTKPWELRKSNVIEHKKRLETIICVTLEVLRVSGIILNPIIPGLSTKLLNKLSVEENSRQWKDLSTFIWNAEVVEKTVSLDSSLDAVLFRRIQLEETEINGKRNVKKESPSIEKKRKKNVKV